MRIASMLLVTLGVAACGDDGNADHVDAGVDARVDAMIDAPSPDAAPMFGAATSLGIAQTAGVIDDDPTMTDDLLELYFNRDGDIFVTKRPSVSGAWSAPAKVTELSSTSNETTPEITGDGLEISFASDRPGTAGENDIWTSTRATRDAVWGTPTRIAEVSSAADEAGGAMTDDQLALVLASLRDGPTPEIYVSTRASKTAAWGTPVRVTTNTDVEHSPQLSQDKLTLYFDKGGEGGTGEDIYQATRTSLSEPFTNATKVDGINSARDDDDVWISSDGLKAVFDSDRAQAGTFVFYITTR